MGIGWPSVDGVSSWDITTPDGQHVMARKSHFVDNSQAESGTYVISGRSVSGHDVYHALTIPDVSELSASGKSGPKGLTSLSGDIAGSGQWRGLAWDAFIEEEFVDGTAWGVEACQEKDEYVYYGGDDRSYVDSIQDTYAGSEPRFRIATLVASMWRDRSWVNPGFYDNYVGEEAGLTRAYNAEYELVATERADAAAGIDLVKGTSEILPPELGSLGLSTREVVMSVADPLCTPRVVGGEAPTVDVEFTYRHTSNGWVTVNATHDKAPMHEVFWSAAQDEGDPSKPNGCLYRFKNRGLEHLSGLFGRVDVTLDFNPDQEAPACVTVE